MSRAENALQTHVQAEAHTLTTLSPCPHAGPGRDSSPATRQPGHEAQHLFSAAAPACCVLALCFLSLWGASLRPSFPSLPSLPSSHPQRQTERQRAGVQQTCVTAKEVRQPPRSLFISPRPATHTTYPRAKAPKMSAAVWHVWHVCEWRSMHVCKWHARSVAPASRTRGQSGWLLHPSAAQRCC
jgi:hypothetical protein